MKAIRRLGDREMTKQPCSQKSLEESLHDRLRELDWMDKPKEDNEPVFAGDSFSRNALCCSTAIPNNIGFNDLTSNEITINSGSVFNEESIWTDQNVQIKTDTAGTYIGDSPDDTNYIGDPIDNDSAYKPNPYIISWPDNQSPYTISHIGTSSTFSIIYNKNDKYAVMNLPQKDMPMAIYVCGRMLTFGILGTDVECAYTGGQVVFEPGAISAIQFGGRITLSVEYRNAIYHYNVGQNGVVTYEGENSSTLEVALVSTIKKDGVLSGGR